MKWYVSGTISLSMWFFSICFLCTNCNNQDSSFLWFLLPAIVLRFTFWQTFSLVSQYTLMKSFVFAECILPLCATVVGWFSNVGRALRGRTYTSIPVFVTHALHINNNFSDSSFSTIIPMMTWCWPWLASFWLDFSKFIYFPKFSSCLKLPNAILEFSLLCITAWKIITDFGQMIRAIVIHSNFSNYCKRKFVGI
jgi:hypothetical protein